MLARRHADVMARATQVNRDLSSFPGPRRCFEECRCLRRFECIGGAAYDQIIVAAMNGFRFAADLSCRDVILREHQQHKIADIGPDGGAWPEGR
jgi:hypothetical protein